MLIVVLLAGCRAGGIPRVATAPGPAAPFPRQPPAVWGTQAAPMLVRRAALSSEVDELAQAAARVHVLAVSTGGYVEREERAERSASLTLRLPEPRLDAALDTLSRLGKVLSRSQSAQDVSDEVIDVEARVRTLTASRDRLRDLLARANGVTDVVTVEKELARVQGELESLQGRLQHLRSSAALAEVAVSLHQKVILGPLGKLFNGIGRALGKLFVIR